ncbi:MAG: hypothetical protein ACYTKD_13785 [Planctomycetota bacterium]
MGTVADALAQDTDDLTAGAVEALNLARGNFLAWVDLVRDQESPSRFRWAVDSLRDANIAATAYVLEAATVMDAVDELLTADGKCLGIEWVRSMEVAPGRSRRDRSGADLRPGIFHDPALVERKPPDFEGEWPPPGGHYPNLNLYALKCLTGYGEHHVEVESPPPPGWPQTGDDDVLGWVKRTELKWSWIGRALKRLVYWVHEGTAPLGKLAECIAWAHSRQDPETGYWDNSIQHTFKLLILVHDPAGLPVPRARELTDSVISRMDGPRYDVKLFPCVEFDAFYDLAIAQDSAPGYRLEEIRKIAAHRIRYIVESHTQADRGLSSYIEHCSPTWNCWDMARELPQGDAFGWGIYGKGMNYALGLLGCADRVAWTGVGEGRDGDPQPAMLDVGAELIRRHPELFKV